MAKVTYFQKFDRNRLMKTYPFIQRTPRFVHIASTGVNFEIGQACFNGSHTVTYTFERSYSTPPTIVIAPRSDDVVVWISSISASSVTFEASAPTNACVDFQSFFQGE